ncbi:MAG: MFS transporter [Zoogloeaceae bacterium]|nr:MFS transporter [Zoogloeaceae bacterium]
MQEAAGTITDGNGWWGVVLAATVVLLVTTGLRLTLGLFVSPLNSATGLGIVTISLVMAVSQLTWGVAQPVFGALADRYGALRALVVGTVMLALGLAATPFARSEATLMLCIGVLIAAGAGAGSYSVVLGATARVIPPHRRGFVSGFVNAGGSFGQFLFAPFLQVLIAGFSWVHAFFTSAVIVLATLPLAWKVGRAAPAQPVAAAGEGLRAQLTQALGDRSYWCLHAGFFTCGFHIAFLVTHLPGEVGLCGLPASVSAASLAIIGLANIAGCLGAGMLSQRYRMKGLLAAMYASRAALVVLYLMAPKTEWTFYFFAAGLGVTWLATVPPTAGLVGKLFGLRYLSTLFGLTLLSHQIGAFFGAWLGGIALARSGNYDWMWYADIVLALAAALVNLPIREAPVIRATKAAA